MSGPHSTAIQLVPRRNGGTGRAGEPANLGLKATTHACTDRRKEPRR
jgi:hypothetical protein